MVSIKFNSFSISDYQDIMNMVGRSISGNENYTSDEPGIALYDLGDVGGGLYCLALHIADHSTLRPEDIFVPNEDYHDHPSKEDWPVIPNEAQLFISFEEHDTAKIPYRMEQLRSNILERLNKLILMSDRFYVSDVSRRKFNIRIMPQSITGLRDILSNEIIRQEIKDKPES